MKKKLTDKQKYRNYIRTFKLLDKIINRYYEDKAFSFHEQEELIREKKYDKIFEYSFVLRIKSGIKSLIVLLEGGFVNEAVIILRTIFEYMVLFSLFYKEKAERNNIVKDWIYSGIQEEIDSTIKMGTREKLEEIIKIFETIDKRKIKGSKYWYGNYAANFTELLKRIDENNFESLKNACYSYSSKIAHGTPLGFMSDSLSILFLIGGGFLLLAGNLIGFLKDFHGLSETDTDVLKIKKILKKR